MAAAAYWQPIVHHRLSLTVTVTKRRSDKTSLWGINIGNKVRTLWTPSGEEKKKFGLLLPAFISSRAMTMFKAALSVLTCTCLWIWRGYSIVFFIIVCGILAAAIWTHMLKSYRLLLSQNKQIFYAAQMQGFNVEGITVRRSILFKLWLMNKFTGKWLKNVYNFFYWSIKKNGKLN